jgi:hypothetical protein
MCCSPDIGLEELKKSMNTQVTCLLADILTRTFHARYICAKHLSQTFGWNENFSYFRGFSFISILSCFIAEKRKR